MGQFCLKIKKFESLISKCKSLMLISYLVSLFYNLFEFTKHNFNLSFFTKIVCN